MKSNLLFALLGGGVVALAVALTGIGYLLGTVSNSPSRSAGDGRASAEAQPPTSLGPQVEMPDPQGSPILAHGWRTEVRCEPYSDCAIGHDFGSAGDGCTNAHCARLWSWSVRDPYPLEGPSLEFINLRLGANTILASGTSGEAGTGYFSPVRAVNRSGHTLLIEFYFILIGERVLNQ